MRKRELAARLKGARRLAIVGIGSSVRGDDAAGLRVIERLRATLRKTKQPLPIKLFSCATTPENHTGEIKKFNPSHIIIVDAADMGKAAGSLRLIEPQVEKANVSFSTHSLSIELLVNYLSHFLDCQILIMGIQPTSVEFGAPLSAAVGKAVTGAARLISGSLPC